MLKQLGILLLALIAAVGFSGAVAAQPYDQGFNGGSFIGPGHKFHQTTVIIINRHHRHHFFPWWWWRHHRHHQSSTSIIINR